MNRSLPLAASIALMFVLGFTHTPVAAACSDSSAVGDCLDEFKNGARATVRATNDPQRAQSVGEAVRNCWNCANEALSKQMREFNNKSGGQGKTTR